MAKINAKFQDLGFGSKITQAGKRLIHKDGSFNIDRQGDKGWSPYQLLLSMSPLKFGLSTFLFFVGINALFAIAFLFLGIEQLSGVPEGSLFSDFLYAFFFSIQTFTTVGYGGISPIGISANFVASLCALIGLISFALVTGLFFARFSKPRSHISFSHHALITNYPNGPSFQFRIVNNRDHKIINLKVRVIMTWLEKQGQIFNRRFSVLPLERDDIVLFPLNWTIVHPINEESPMYQKSLEDLTRMHAEIIVMVTGFDESYNQQIHGDSSYICDEIHVGKRFKPMYISTDSGATQLYLDDLNELMDE